MIALFLTFSRIVVTPFIVGAIFYKWWGIAALLFVGAALTDVLDGAVARYLDQQTELGACLDPIADKFLIISCYAALLCVHCPLVAIPGWFLVFIIAKEILQILAVIYLRFIHSVIYIKPSILGKLTTVIQSIFIMVFFMHPYNSWLSHDILNGMLAIALLLNSATLVHYGFIAYYGWRSWNISK